MSKLSINAAPRKDRSKQEGVADSWDDAESDSANDSEQAARKTAHASKPSQSYPSAPPPTPMSPKFSYTPNLADAPQFKEPRQSRDSSSEKRPEKTTQTASRLIAAGLGVRAPARTEEQKAYDKAVREQEAKRIKKQKEDKRKEEQERERAKQAIWDD